MKDRIKNILIFRHPNNKRALAWSKKISGLIKRDFPNLKEDTRKPNIVIALGGDGTILEAARKYQKLNPIIIGLNLGTVGFLASVREEKNFLKSLRRFFKGKYKIVERMMIMANVRRKGQIVFSSEALNEVVVKSLLGIVELQAKIEGHPVQYIRGTGILVATATGSTAYNLSAHGPIVMPDIKCLIVTELLDHSIPTPSIVIKYHNKIILKIIDYRTRGLLSLSKTGKRVDVLLSADGNSIFPLEAGDEVVIQSSPRLIRFAELEKHYFFKSLQEKFGFK